MGSASYPTGSGGRGLARSGRINRRDPHCFGGPTEADIRIIVAALTGVVALAAISAQVVPSGKNDSWRPLDTAQLFGLGDEACGSGWHQELRRDWWGEWWWGGCVPNK